ncbi:GntR family transcriptional regulator [Actinokineospora spheciospongiae]|uniref:GntR family transcriptional regulator n=1 Tax=Actinokineospora spheciospongiae TaxID=909613 RepID=UPI000D7181C2|nr:GntR family transcriptional regulator [Actinokineospora spheciospongiae]PWW59533.1 GntR family transcriptional regulator [Actinokineospora spheciospongiae]
MTTGRFGYREIADELRDRIDSGALAPNAKVPGENELMATYGVEQPTARRALDVLKNEGLIIARRGAGTFVREFRPRWRVSPDRLSETVWATGDGVWSSDDSEQPPRVLDIGITREPPPPAIAEVLGTDRVVVRTRTYAIDDNPIQLATSYYPADLVEGSRVTEEDTGPGGVYARLAELGHKPTLFREQLRCRMPRADQAAALGLAQGTPVVEIMRTAYTADERVVEVNTMVLDSSAYMLEYRFTS